ncbi:PepSY domain-containing protein [Actinomadura coerulea]|uniref:PepSY domain-containing protein n=1 Tax=Actinomadura coerulea TaxID=46159 RepID=UPI003426A6B0
MRFDARRMVAGRGLLVTVVAAGALAAGGATAAIAAADGGDGDSPSGGTPARTAVSLTRAADAALKAVPGHATSAGFDRHGGKAVWEVDVTGAGGSEHEVTVDAATGKVVAEEADDDD